MIDGGLDASFFIVYVGQGPLTPDGYDKAYKQAVEKFEAIHRLTKEIAPDKIELALTAADVRRINAKGKKVALIGIENGYPIGEDITRVKEFYDRGGRYLSLAHNGHSQLADSNNGEASGVWLHNGLSPLGRQVIAEANKWGIMIDLSHPSKPANLQAIALSKAPVIASHSAVRALADHSRNMDDEQLMALKRNGGVIQMVAFASYVKTDSPERRKALDALSDEQRTELQNKLTDVDQRQVRSVRRVCSAQELWNLAEAGEVMTARHAGVRLKPDTTTETLTGGVRL
jgi:membrane dipeptidase